MSHGHHHHGDESHSHDHNHDQSHPHHHDQPPSGERKWHRDWRIWVAALLMIGILIYCLATFIL